MWKYLSVMWPIYFYKSLLQLKLTRGVYEFIEWRTIARVNKALTPLLLSQRQDRLTGLM